MAHLVLPQNTKPNLRKAKRVSFVNTLLFLLKRVIILLSICLTLLGCNRKDNKLPIFKFINQDSLETTENTFDGKIYLADFIFLSCPTICPNMTLEMTKVCDTYKSNPKSKLLVNANNRITCLQHWYFCYKFEPKQTCLTIPSQAKNSEANPCKRAYTFLSSAKLKWEARTNNNKKNNEVNN